MKNSTWIGAATMTEKPTPAPAPPPDEGATAPLRQMSVPRRSRGPPHHQLPSRVSAARRACALRPSAHPGKSALLAAAETGNPAGILAPAVHALRPIPGGIPPGAMTAPGNPVGAIPVRLLPHPKGGTNHIGPLMTVPPVETHRHSRSRV